MTESAPEFHPMPIDCSFDDLTRSLGPAQGPNFHDGKVDEVKIKLEGGRKNAGSVAADQTASGKKSTGLGTDWPRACDSLLRSIINRQRAHGVSKKDLAAALPQIEGIVSIAQKHGLAHEVHGDFDSLFLEYIGNDSFWELIAKEPVRCLRIGMALRNLPVYEEAFKHLVGMSANSKAGKRFRGLPDEIQANLQRRSRELYNLRRDVNEDLFLISLPAQPPVSLQYPSITVSQQDEPDAYSTVNIFRDWMADHIGYLRGNTSEPPHPYYLCGHEGGCNTIAGFYSIIAAGGEAYLPFDTVWDDFNKDFLQQDEEDPNELDHGAVKEPLAELKTQASKLVSDLAKSTLHLPSTDGLDYLTCVKVGPEDVPWDVSDKDGEGEYSDGD